MDGPAATWCAWHRPRSLNLKRSTTLYFLGIPGAPPVSSKSTSLSYMTPKFPRGVVYILGGNMTLVGVGAKTNVTVNSGEPTYLTPSVQRECEIWFSADSVSSPGQTLHPP